MSGASPSTVTDTRELEQIMKTYTIVCEGCRTSFQVSHPPLRAADDAATLSLVCPGCDQELSGEDSMILICRQPKNASPSAPTQLQEYLSRQRHNRQ